MKKLLTLIIILFMPFMVYAENCETNKVTISNIHLVEESNSAIEVSEAKINGNTVKLNLGMKDLNDKITYSLTIKNNSSSDYEINNNFIDSNSEYIVYELSTKDNSNVIKAGTSKDAMLSVIYKNQVKDNDFSSNKFNLSRTIKIDLSSGTNDIVNPKTGSYSYVFILIMFIICFTIIYLIINKSKYSKYFILFLLLIPIGLKAVCKIEVNIIVDVEIAKSNISYLMAGTNGEYNTNFLRTNIVKQNIEKITFAPSIDGHTANGTDCFDVSMKEDATVLAWVTDSDSNGKYEMTIGSDGKVYASNGSYLFSDLINLTHLEGMQYFDTSYVTDMSYMFYHCDYLVNFDLSHFNTARVTIMKGMFMMNYPDHEYNDFYGKITSLDLSSFNTSKVTDMSYMFANSVALRDINISSFNTSKVTDMSYMFYECEVLNAVDLTKLNTTKVTNMSYMFYGCFSMTSMNLTHFNTSNVTNMSYMFDGCRSLTEIDVSSFDTSKVTDMQSMFNGCSKIKNFDLSTFNTANVLDMNCMFESCYEATSIILTNFDTSKVTNMYGMFWNCRNIIGIDVSSFDTSNVTNMYLMFSYCEKLLTLDLTNFNTQSVTTMGSMFAQCYEITSLNVSSFNTSNVTSMSQMFSSCKKLESLDLSNFNTSSVIDMYGMFWFCESFTTLDLSNFDTSNVTRIDFMFSNCISLVTLDLSGFDTSKVTNILGTFGDCSKLVTIYASNSFVINGNPLGSNTLFSDCTSLVGGQGTTYSSSRVSKTYARIDGGPSLRGYFTEKQ